jgi:hypothetical protein
MSECICPAGAQGSLETDPKCLIHGGVVNIAKELSNYELYGEVGKQQPIYDFHSGQPVARKVKFDREVVITVTRDGNTICALIGDNLQTGIAGFGVTIAEALLDLSTHIETDLLPSSY